MLRCCVDLGRGRSADGDTCCREMRPHCQLEPRPLCSSGSCTSHTSFALFTSTLTPTAPRTVTPSNISSAPEHVQPTCLGQPLRRDLAAIMEVPLVMHVVLLRVSHSVAAASGAGHGCTHTYMNRLRPRPHPINTVATTQRTCTLAAANLGTARCFKVCSSMGVLSCLCVCVVGRGVASVAHCLGKILHHLGSQDAPEELCSSLLRLLPRSEDMT